MERKLWLLTIVGSTIGSLIAIFGIMGANGAPQECAASAIGLACAAIPYCLARAVSEFERLPQNEAASTDEKK